MRVTPRGGSAARSGAGLGGGRAEPAGMETTCVLSWVREIPPPGRARARSSQRLTEAVLFHGVLPRWVARRWRRRRRSRPMLNVATGSISGCPARLAGPTASRRRAGSSRRGAGSWPRRLSEGATRGMAGWWNTPGGVCAVVGQSSPAERLTDCRVVDAGVVPGERLLTRSVGLAGAGKVARRVGAGASCPRKGERWRPSQRRRTPSRAW